MSQYYDFIFFFFFQAEDGIRDRNVTGVQTCALPISVGRANLYRRPPTARATLARSHALGRLRRALRPRRFGTLFQERQHAGEIGRASCRERVEISVVAEVFKKKKQQTADRQIMAGTS